MEILSISMVILVFALLLANIFQVIYWTKLNSQLIDKLMSRNYAEYVQTNMLSSPRDKQAGPSLDPEDKIDDDALAELNKQFFG